MTHEHPAAHYCQEPVEQPSDASPGALDLILAYGRVGKAIARSLGVELSGPEMTRLGTDRAYAEACHELYALGTRHGYDEPRP